MEATRCRSAYRSIEDQTAERQVCCCAPINDMLPDYEDLTGRVLRWDYVRGYPLEVSITMEGQEAGRLWKATNLKPEVEARLAGVEWRMLESQSQKRIGFSDSRLWLATAYSLWFGLGDYAVPKSAEIDGVRSYDFIFDSSVRTHALNEEGEVCLGFLRDRTATSSMEGRIEIASCAEPLDAPPLALLGILYALGGGLYRREYQSE